MPSSYTLILTGEVLPGFTPEAVWPRLAADFGILPGQLAQLQTRAPQIIKRSGDPDKLQTLQDRFTQCGAQTEIYPPDDRPELFVLIDNAPHGPVPRELVERYLERSVWAADTLRVAEDGSTEWVPYTQVDDALSLEPSFAPPSAPEPHSGGAMTMMPASHTTPKWEDDPSGEGKVLPASDAVHAGFWRRWGAFMADSLIYVVAMIGVLAIFSLAPIGFGPTLVTILFYIGPWLYFALMESSSWQATLGKRVMGIKVADEHGRRIGFGRATGRYFGKILSGIIFYIGFMMAGWTERRQALHDMMAGTFVVFDAVQPDQPLPKKRPPLPWYVFAPLILYCLLGILAAIALPAYQDHVFRTRVTEAIDATDTIRSEIAQQGCLSGSRIPPRPWIGMVEVQGNEKTESCTITLSLSDSSITPALTRGKIIELERDDAGNWRCSSSLPTRYLPPNCR